MLVAAKAITEEQLAKALEQQRTTHEKLGATLINMGILTEIQIRDALHNQTGVEIVDLAAIKIPSEVLNLINDSGNLRKNVCMPFGFDKYDMQTLKVAMSDPSDLIACDEIEMMTGLQVSPVLSTPSEIMACIDKYYGSAETQAVADAYAKERAVELAAMEEEEEDAGVENAPIVILVKKIIEQGVRLRASDIHIEPMENRIRVRYRIDGVLVDTNQSYSVNMLSAIIARVKIVGGMDISEKRKPQDGRITQVVDRVEYDIRVSILPTVFGEKVVMRLTAKLNLTRDKKQLGFSDRELKRFDRIFKNPYGIILVTGPTGSGKSTTLYTMLSELNTGDVNIVTVEDPVEANIDGINQVQVNPKADLTFATALRSILRQDPDIIMIGEIRDRETAQIAVTASVTGHLVVSTLHTNSAASSIIRLEDMGIESYLIADSTVGVIAQRLTRRLCTCKVCREATDTEKRMLGVSEDEELKVYDPKGCNVCNDTGYIGRIGVYEIMPVTSKIRGIISRRGSKDDIERVAIAEGMMTLKQNCAKLVMDGVTSMAEMKRIVYSNEDDMSFAADEP